MKYLGETIIEIFETNKNSYTENRYFAEITTKIIREIVKQTKVFTGKMKLFADTEPELFSKYICQLATETI